MGVRGEGGGGGCERGRWRRWEKMREEQVRVGWERWWKVGGDKTAKGKKGQGLGEGRRGGEGVREGGAGRE